MKSKKHVFHPKSYPVPAQLPSTSRNLCSGNMIKGGTLQVQAKTTVTRTAKSPPGNSKKVLDIPIQQNPKLIMAKQETASKPQVIAKVINPGFNKVLKKSLSNNDIQSVVDAKTDVSNKQRQPAMQVTLKTQTTTKRHSPSPTQQLKSPSPPREGSAKQSMKVGASKQVKGKISEFQTKPASGSSNKGSTGSPPPWADFMYLYNNNV